ncbi:MAG: PorP/SprF family type IX secretion system membrane protein [Bacteroidales bacterium]|nr:PorP/SprF family type IX secretion system membrane protein [Bacteroidales bacterium]
MKTVVLFVISMIVSVYLWSQDVVFSQIHEAPILLNPANAGAQHDIRANLNFRQQWRSVTEPFVTMAASADMKLFSQKRSSSAGVGVFVLNDRAGGAHLNTFQSGIIAAGKVPVASNQNISGGIGLSFLQRHVDFASLSWDKQYDGLMYNPDLPTGETLFRERTSTVDVSTGVQWSYGKGATTLSSNDNFGAQVGVAVLHLNKPNIGFNEDPSYWRYVIHGTFSYGVKNSNMQISPSFMTTLQGPSKMFFLGTIVKYKLQESSKYTDYILARMINVGTFYRWGDAIVMSAQLEWGQYAFGISYDINVSSLTKVSYGRGGFEISARYFPLRSSASSRLL